jgi:hypothetical protein
MHRAGAPTAEDALPLGDGSILAQSERGGYRNRAGQIGGNRRMELRAAKQLHVRNRRKKCPLSP